jgi:gliding motility-associated-like protein
VNLQVNNPAAICGGTSADLTNSSITSGSSNGLSYTYWQDAGATIPLANPNAVTTSGTYYIQATNSSGCTEIKPVSVSILPLPSGRINGGGAICEGSSQNMVINLSGVAPFTITYSNGTTNYTISGINANSYILTVSPAITTTYTIVSVKDANCTNTGNNSTATITVNPNVAGIRYPDITAGVNTPTPVDARDFGNSYVYDWSPGIGLLSYSTRSTTFYYDQTVEYFIRISNGSGCDIVDTVKIIVENRSNDPKSGIWVPNAWSPNSSGKNDVLRPLCLNITQIKFFRIFNRWGQLMFETSRIGEGWNGIWNGKPQVNDVYTWTLEAYGIDGIRYFKSGNSILLR